MLVLFEVVNLDNVKKVGEINFSQDIEHLLQQILANIFSYTTQEGDKEEFRKLRNQLPYEKTNGEQLSWCHHI